MPTKIVSFISLLVKRILNNVAKNLWDEFWTKVLEYVVKAEEYWNEEGKGKQKKDWVSRRIKDFVMEHKELSWIKIKILDLFLSIVLDALIATLNEELGQDWKDYIEELEDNWKDEIFNSA